VLGYAGVGTVVWEDLICMATKVFTLEQARALIPALRELLEAANDELESFHLRLEEVNDQVRVAEARLDAADLCMSEDPGADGLQMASGQYERAIAELSAAQKDFLDRLNYWVDRISENGVILRDIRSGLLDFPARQGKLDYFLCWCLGEDDILYWHLVNDGFIGRKPLAILGEYF